MNIAFFLLPKSQVVWLPTRATLAQAIQRMENSGYTALPLLDDDECYAGTITEGDLLRKLLQTPGLDRCGADMPLTRVQLKTKVCPVGVPSGLVSVAIAGVAMRFASRTAGLK